MMTQSQFEILVAGKVGSGLSYIKAVYAVLDECLKKELDSSDIAFACQKGCAICCYQMILCTKPEMDEVILYIRRMEKKARRRLKKGLEASAREWEQYYAQNKMVIQHNPLLFLNDWMGKRCPFLSSDGACVIYPVRIIDCRTLSSLTKCANLETRSPKRLRFDFEVWANNLILEYQEERFGYQAVSSLGHWLCVFINNNWQPLADSEIRIGGI